MSSCSVVSYGVSCKSELPERARATPLLVYICLSASLEGVLKGMFVRGCSESCIIKGCSERGVTSDGRVR